MKKQTGLAKAIVGLVLVICAIVGGFYGFGIDFDITDVTTGNTNIEEDFVPLKPMPDEKNDSEDVDVETTDDTTDVVEDVVDTEQSPADSAPTEDETPSADESGEEEVTQPTDNTEEVVTEGEN